MVKRFVSVKKLVVILLLLSVGYAQDSASLDYDSLIVSDSTLIFHGLNLRYISDAPVEISSEAELAIGIEIFGDSTHKEKELFSSVFQDRDDRSYSSEMNCYTQYYKTLSVDISAWRDAALWDVEVYGIVAKNHLDSIKIALPTIRFEQ